MPEPEPSGCDVQEPSVRQQCSGMMLQFILDYPLGARRLQHHLQFLITNLSFEHESGRQAAVDTIKVRLPSLLAFSVG